MKISVDTNVLVRAAVRDDPHQCEIAAKTLSEATVVVVSSLVLCEFYWVLARGYKIPTGEIIDAMRRLMDCGNVVIDQRAAIEAGMAFVAAGGDFADGVIAYQGELLGADEFVTFDAKAGEILTKQGAPVRVLK